jgi:hypothetical protein
VGTVAFCNKNAYPTLKFHVEAYTWKGDFNEKPANPTRITCFDPIINEQTTTMILGSLPSPLSLQYHQYYGNPNNKFWPIIYDLFAQTPPDSDTLRAAAFS